MIKNPIRIILADDDQDDRQIFEDILNEIDLNCIVQTANDCTQLMTLLHNEDDTVLPDLLFLDLNMPHKNGLTCLKEIRSNEAFNDITIAIYSTSTSENDIDETFHHGANIYITKPSDYNALKKILIKAVTVTVHNQVASFHKENFILRL